MALLTPARSGLSGQLILLSNYSEKQLFRTNSPKLKSPFLADVTQHLIGLCPTNLYSTNVSVTLGYIFQQNYMEVSTSELNCLNLNIPGKLY